MKKVLVYGLKDPVGGVEQVVMSYVNNLVRRFDITFDFLVFTDNFSLEAEIKELGCRVITLPVRRKNPTGYKKSMAQVFQDNQYCAVWGNFSGLTNIDILVLAKKWGIPVRIAHSHVSKLYWGTPIMKYVVHLLHYYNQRRLKHYANRYFACSRMAGDFMFPAETRDQTIYVRNAVDMERFSPDNDCRREMRASLGISSDTLVVGHVARMCEVKNQKFLLDIMKQFASEDVNVKLLLVGDGELRQQLEAQVEALGITDRVILTGNRRDIPELLRAMDVYVLTSFSEGLSLSAVEAQACGLPCVLSDAVSEETDISGGVVFLSLDEPPCVWTETILGQAGRKVVNTKEKMIDSGYEISDASHKLFRILTGDAT